MFVIDEADRILEIGFEEDMRAIVKLLPAKERQTALFSATQVRGHAMGRACRSWASMGAGSGWMRPHAA